jgi:hypothetical protein
MGFLLDTPQAVLAQGIPVYAVVGIMTLNLLVRMRASIFGG